MENFCLHVQNGHCQGWQASGTSGVVVETGYHSAPKLGGNHGMYTPKGTPSQASATRRFSWSCDFCRENPLCSPKTQTTVTAGQDCDETDSGKRKREKCKRDLVQEHCIQQRTSKSTTTQQRTSKSTTTQQLRRRLVRTRRHQSVHRLDLAKRAKTKRAELLFHYQLKMLVLPLIVLPLILLPLLVLPRPVQVNLRRIIMKNVSACR